MGDSNDDHDHDHDHDHDLGRGIDASLLERVADRYGLDVTTSEERAASVRSTAALAEAIEVESYESPKATNVREGEDGYNAFLYRFDLSGEDGSGPLADLSVAVKDNVVVAGVPMTCGSAAVDFTPSYSATVVERLRTAGADLVGTTNMDEFAYFTTGETCVHGRVENPVVDGGVPGGSSAGSGAAVAAGLVDAALGSDTGGSIRIPASYCGVVGLKPTHRAVSRFGFADLAPSLDHVGPLARDVQTAARVFETIAGPDSQDLSSVVSPAPEAGNLTEATGTGVEGLHVGLVRGALEGATDGVGGAVRETAHAMEDDGVTVERVTVEGYDEAPLALSVITGAEFAELLANAGQVYGSGTGYAEPWRAAVAAATEVGDYGENVREQLLTHGALTEATNGAAYVRAQTARRAFTDRVDALFEEFDVLLTPTTPTTAPDFGEVTGDAGLLRTIADTGPFDLTGHPAVSVPCGTHDGAPVGCQVVAARHDEPTAVRVAAAVETERHG
jgi:aspartyl-tRNA(Asn)/glutamyl-tRNA(Gln) amidotransferase subunit A